MEGAVSGERRDYLVLNRSWADLYDEIARLFADRPDITVVVDRRRAGVRAPLRADEGRVLMDEGQPLSARLVPERFR